MTNKNENDENLRQETISVSNTNSIAKSGFGMLERLIREKPNFNMITFEAITLRKYNKTCKNKTWKQNLTPENLVLC